MTAEGTVGAPTCSTQDTILELKIVFFLYLLSPRTTSNKMLIVPTYGIRLFGESQGNGVVVL
jgi:hypothetical protein